MTAYCTRYSPLNLVRLRSMRVYVFQTIVEWNKWWVIAFIGLCEACECLIKSRNRLSCIYTTVHAAMCTRRPRNHQRPRNGRCVKVVSMKWSVSLENRLRISGFFLLFINCLVTVSISKNDNVHKIYIATYNRGLRGQGVVTYNISNRKMHNM